jgi:hypothetical protein
VGKYQIVVGTSKELVYACDLDDATDYSYDYSVVTNILTSGECFKLKCIPFFIIDFF